MVTLGKAGRESQKKEANESSNKAPHGRCLMEYAYIYAFVMIFSKQGFS